MTQDSNGTTTPTTPRGFLVYADFTDSHGRRVRVQQSSAYGLAHVWIFTNDPDGTDVKHWKAGGGWEPAPSPGAGDPPWREGDPPRVMSEGWSAVSPHLDPDGCRALIAALQAHLDVVEREGLGVADESDEEDEEDDDGLPDDIREVEKQLRDRLLGPVLRAFDAAGGSLTTSQLSVALGAPALDDGAREDAFDFRAHLVRQREWSERTFGPGPRPAGLIDHIQKELREIAAAPDDLEEWIDVAILALDGAWRAGYSPDEIIAQLVAKQSKNERREWPDWRVAEFGKAIEHVRDDAREPSPLVALPREAWNEEDGAVLWWAWPVSEPPYAGTPLDDVFPEYVTHWTPIPVPTRAVESWCTTCGEATPEGVTTCAKCEAWWAANPPPPVDDHAREGAQGGS